MTWSTRSSGSSPGSCSAGTRLFTTLGIPSDSGVAWALSIVGLVVVMRAAMIPLFVKQIHASRRMQLIQPEMQKIQAKYKGKTDPESRQAMTQETMDLYKRTGTNPFSSCLPILLQSPFFFGLFRVLNGLKKIADGTDRPDRPDLAQAGRPRPSRRPSSVRQLSDRFLGAETWHTVKIVTIILIILMSATHVHHPAPADDEEHAGLGAGQPVRQAAEDAALPDADLLRDLRRQLPDRCPALLADHQRLVDVPAVLRDPQHAGARAPRPRRPCRSGGARRASRSRSSPSRASTSADEAEAPKPSGQRVAAQAQQEEEGPQPTAAANGGQAKPPATPASDAQAPSRRSRDRRRPTEGRPATDPKPQTDN